ncbi:hypothetical protein SO802_010510 [Lithocarpus litseifolius]|uniref:Uncharacterized protein n=1 Tax=Lithocarpus litseifolius TaxID=425828 RepID=A0AAW2DHE1_9ROSI
MALKVKSSDTDESSDDKDSKTKSYITWQFKKFMKNANAKGFDKDCRQSSSSQSKSQDKGKKDSRDGEEELVESKFEKMDEQDNIHTTYTKLYKVFKKREKLYGLATKMLNNVELEREELSTKFDEANQIIGALRFKNNFVG